MAEFLYNKYAKLRTKSDAIAVAAATMKNGILHENNAKYISNMHNRVAERNRLKRLGAFNNNKIQYSKHNTHNRRTIYEGGKRKTRKTRKARKTHKH